MIHVLGQVAYVFKGGTVPPACAHAIVFAVTSPAALDQPLCSIKLPSSPLLCRSPGGMVRLAHAVIKHFLLAFKVRGVVYKKR